MPSMEYRRCCHHGCRHRRRLHNEQKHTVSASISFETDKTVANRELLDFPFL